MSVVGFDLGHQTCFIAVARQGGIETIANEYSDRCTPSVVSFGAKQRYMGLSAKNQMVANIKNTVSGWKKMTGRKFRDPVVTAECARLPYEVVECADGSTGIKVQYMEEGQVFSPNQVTAMMLSKLKETATIALKMKVVDCVISVPCYFADGQRRALLDASRVAGLNCLRLLNDTTATALAYGIYKQDLPAPDERARHVVFVDFGYSDLQVAVAAFNKGKLKVLATASDPELGGRDFDALLAQHFAVEFLKRYKVDATRHARAWVRLLSECEKLKKLMSANSTQLSVNIECFIDDKDVTGRMNRDDMEALAAPLFARARETMASVLQNANLKLADLDAVEVVGGASRIPAFKQLVQSVFDKEPRTTLNADESVVRGCALQCAILSPTFRVRDFVITDCQPYPITLCWQATMEEDSTAEVFSRFHAVPFSKMLTFYRKEPFALEARYTDACVSQNPSLGVFNVDKVVPQSDGSTSKVKVKLRVNLHGIFNVSSATMLERPEPTAPEPEPMEPVAMERENGPEAEAAVGAGENDLAGVSADAPPNGEKAAESEEAMQVDESQEKDGKDTKEPKEKTPKKKKPVVKVIDLSVTACVPQLNPVDLNLHVEKEGQMMAQDKLEKERIDSKNYVEEYVYEMRDKLGSSLERFVKEKDRATLQSLLSNTENWLYEDGEDEKKQVYIDKLAQLKKLGQPIADRYWEAEMRPSALQELGQTLQLMRKAVELYDEKDERYVHLEAADVDKVRKCVAEKTDWFDKTHSTLAQLPAYDTSPLTVAAIRSQKDALYSTCNPIMSKPKPKPKETPPPPPPPTEEKTDEGDKTAGEDGAAKGAPTDGPAPGPADVDMELD